MENMNEASQILRIGSGGRIILGRKVRKNLGLKEGDFFHAEIHKIRVEKLFDSGKGANEK